MSAIAPAGTQTPYLHQAAATRPAPEGSPAEEASESPAAEQAEQARAGSGSRVDLYA